MTGSYLASKGYFVTFRADGGYDRATLMFKDVKIYRLFLLTKLGIK